MTVPSDDDFIGNNITESQFKNALSVLLDHIRQMPITQNFFESSNSENLFEWKDSAGNVVLALNKRASSFRMMKIQNDLFC